MSLSLILAVSKNNVIGNKGKLPWNLPAELAHFKKVTLGHPIIMGRKTFESIGRPLPRRTNIVVSHNPSLGKEDVLVAGSLDEAIRLATDSPGGEESFIIGGRSLFEEAEPIADNVYLTRVDAEVAGDVKFEFNPNGWEQVGSSYHPADEENTFGFEVSQWRRKT